MKLKNYPLFCLVIIGLLFVGCEAARRESVNEARAKQAEAVTVAADTAAFNFFSRNLSEAQIDSVWKSKGY